MDKKINLHPKFNKNVEFLCIEYPGIVANVNKMLATVGGLKHIKEVYVDSSKRLDLKFRPNDPCSKPLCADRTSGLSLLLKVCKFKRRKKDGDKDEFTYRQSICGIVHTNYKFHSLCDYQYLPLQKDDKTGQLKSMIPHLKIDESVIDDETFFSREVPLFLPPPTFGRLDTPHMYQYRKEHTNYRKTTTIYKTSWEHRISSRKVRPHHCILVKYEAKAPTQCLPKALEDLQARSENYEDARKKLCKAFEDRPVWSRNALQANFSMTLQALKTLLPVHAYYVVSGPWARLWVRYGYDPKLHPEAKRYQLIDFRLRQGIHTPHIPIKAKRSSFNYKLPNLTSKHRGAAKPPSSYVRNPAQGDEDDRPEDNKSSLDPIYLYQPGVLPAHRQIYYQICDIRLPEVEELVKKSDSVDMICSKEEGWLMPNTTAEIRNVITKDIYKTITTRKYGSPREAPQHSTLVDENSGKNQQSNEGPPDLMQSEAAELDGSDPDDDNQSDESSDSSVEESSASRSQDDLLMEDTFRMEADDVPDDEEFDDGGLFFEDVEDLEEQMQTSTVCDDDLIKKQ